MKTGQEFLPHVVIVGAGFGGMETAHRLRRAPVRVTLIDRVNYHTIQIDRLVRRQPVKPFRC